MQMYCLGWRKYTNNIRPKKVTSNNDKKVITQKSRCPNCMSNKSRFLKQKSNESGWNNINPKLFIY